MQNRMPRAWEAPGPTEADLDRADTQAERDAHAAEMKAEAEATEAAEAETRARLSGIMPGARQDVVEMGVRLVALDFIVGARDPRRNTDFKGAWMVAEPEDESELPTRSAGEGHGVWCIVGDDLAELIQETHSRYVEG